MTLQTLMIHLIPGVDIAPLLQLANDVAVRTGARKVIGIAAMRPLEIYAGPDAYVPKDLFEKDWDAMESELRTVEKLFREALGGSAITSEWRSTITLDPTADYIAAQMRAADLLITGPTQGSQLFDIHRCVNVADLVLRAGRPVIVAGKGVRKLDLGSVLVGWNDSREARRAIEDGLPFLRLASEVTVAQIVEAEAMPAAKAAVNDVIVWLQGHGVVAKPRVECGRNADAAVLADLAQELEAGLVVAGAYGHSRMREWVLGGVTRDLMLKPTQCSFVSH